MNTGSLPARPHGNARPGRIAAVAAALLIYTACAPAFAQGAGSGGAGAGISGTSVGGTRVLEASDHAELAAAIPASGMSRIALLGDRVARVIRAPGALRVEHDAASGDLYLHPPGGDGADPAGAAGSGPSVLFIGSERGFTYRLSLVTAPSGAAQILIRNPAVFASASVPDRTVEGSDDRIGALVGLIRAVARREPLAGHAIHAGGAFSGTSVSGLTVIETWRGPRFSALVFEAGPSASGDGEGAAGLAGTIAALPGVAPVAALWLAAPGTGPSGGRLAVAVRESAVGEVR